GRRSCGRSWPGAWRRTPPGGPGPASSWATPSWPAPRPRTATATPPRTRRKRRPGEKRLVASWTMLPALYDGTTGTSGRPRPGGGRAPRCPTCTPPSSAASPSSWGCRWRRCSGAWPRCWRTSSASCTGSTRPWPPRRRERPMKIIIMMMNMDQNVEEPRGNEGEDIQLCIIDNIYIM
ncbi:unnamed protein product, partial [Heterosigma akashiwo]